MVDDQHLYLVSFKSSITFFKLYFVCSDSFPKIGRSSSVFTLLPKIMGGCVRSVAASYPPLAVTDLRPHHTVVLRFFLGASEACVTTSTVLPSESVLLPIANSCIPLGLMLITAMFYTRVEIGERIGWFVSYFPPDRPLRLINLPAASQDLHVQWTCTNHLGLHLLRSRPHQRKGTPPTMAMDHDHHVSGYLCYRMPLRLAIPQ
jgi:hypothetical protein